MARNQSRTIGRVKIKQASILKKSSLMEKNKGFTLIEILIALAVIAVIFTLIIIDYRPYKKELALRQSAQALGSSIRTVQNMALSTSVREQKPIYGYGLEISEGSSSYIIFVDCDGSYQYSPPPSTPCDGKSEIVESISLEKGVKILSIGPKPPLTPNITILFTSPYALTTISGGSESAVITLSLEDDPSKTGQVSVSLSDGVTSISVD